MHGGSGGYRLRGFRPTDPRDTPPMRIVRLEQPKSPLVIAEVPTPEPGAGEVLIDLRAAALNHRDVWITKGLYPGIVLPCTPGSDGSGVVIRVGAGVDARWMDAEVIINPSFAWGEDPRVQGTDFQILGLPRQGTHATHIAVPVAQVQRKPTHLSFEAAAAIPLAGLTAWRALTTRGRARSGETLLITGIGGGVACFALQIGVALGLRCLVTSSSAAKRERALALGATAAYDYTDPDWGKTLKAKGGFDLAIDGAGGRDFNALVEAAKPGGRIVVYGGTAGLPEALNLRAVFFKQLDVMGSTMGSPQDFAAWTAFVEDRKLEPIIDRSFPLDQANAAYARMDAGEQFGKILLRPT